MMTEGNGERSRTMKLETTFQLTLFDLEARLSNRSHTAVGALGEHTARLLFQEAGYVVSRISDSRGDLRVIRPETGECANIEVKTARQGKDRRWKFTLFKKGHANHRRADYILLLAVLPSGQAVPFLVPIGALADQHQAVITSSPLSYAGKLAAYRRSNLHNFM